MDVLSPLGVVVKIWSGLTEWFNVQNKIMQGTVLGLMCITTIDKLYKIIQQSILKYAGNITGYPIRQEETQIGLVLRNSWFMNGFFFLSEMLSGYSSDYLNDLQFLDRKILRPITGVKAKVPIVKLYLETTQLPV